MVAVYYPRNLKSFGAFGFLGFYSMNGVILNRANNSILDLRIEPMQLEQTVDNIKFFPGYHMNKKSWYTICLDGSVGNDEIFERIDISYELAKKK